MKKERTPEEVLKSLHDGISDLLYEDNSNSGGENPFYVKIWFSYRYKENPEVLHTSGRKEFDADSFEDLAVRVKEFVNSKKHGFIVTNV